MKKYILIVILIISSSFYTRANDLYFYHLGLHDGLSQINIMSIYQDEFGVMWFGTTEGLNRYNGREIQTFRPTDEGDGLTQNIIYSIQGNKSGALYINADSDLIRYDLYSQKFSRLKQGGVAAISYRDSLLWVSADREIVLYSDRMNSFRPFAKLNENVDNVTAIHVSDNGVIWLGTRNGLVAMQTKNPEKQEYILQGYTINCVYEDRNSNIWVGTNGNGAYVIKPTGEIVNYIHEAGSNSISNNQVRTIMEDNSGIMWIGTFYGLNKFDMASGIWKEYINKDNIPYTISHSSVFSIFQDLQGTIWVGTYFGGVNYFNTEADFFRYYGASSTNDEYLSFPFVSKMTEDNHNNLWICTEGGALNCLNLATRRFSRYMFNTNKLEAAEFNNLKCIWYSKDKDLLYIGIHSGGLSVFDIKTKRAKNFMADPTKSHSLPNNTINKMQFYNGELVLLTQGGLVKMNLEKELFYPFSDNPFVSGALSNSGYHTFLIDTRDRLWIPKIGGGLLCIDLKSNQIKVYNHDPAKNNTIGRFSISDIFESNSGIIYFSTIGSGIFRYNDVTDDFVNYTEQNAGLMSNYCYSVSESPSGKLIILFNKGFSFFDPAQPEDVLFRSSLSFPLVGFNMGSSVYTTRANEIFIGGVNGLVSFFENNLNRKNDSYNLYFDKLYVNNKSIIPNDGSGILTQTLPFTKEIVLKPGQNNITIEFASSNYLQSAIRSYEYKMEGFDTDWIKTETKIITYTNLSPGTYKLYVRDGAPGAKDSKINELIIEVEPPFYLTKLAYIVYLLLLALILTAIARFYSWRTKMETRLEFERKEKERIEELNNMKFRFFTNISHEFRTPLTLIIGQTDMLMDYQDISANVHNKISRIRKNAGHLQNLITELLDFRKQEQGFNKLNISRIDIVGYIKDIYDSFQEYALKNQIGFRLENPDSPLYIYLDPVQFQKAIYNLLSNAFKFTSQGGEIVIRLEQKIQHISIQIIDNGIGIPAESLHKIFDRFYQLEYRSSGLTLGTGIGLALTKEIILAHKGSIDVESTVNEGSVFTITLQLGNSHFSKEEQEYRDINRPQFAIKHEILIDLDSNDDAILEDKQIVATDKEKPIALLVDDNEELLDMLAESFSSSYNVYTAMDGEAGLDMVLNIQPDIVVSDVMMPKLNGKEMCYHIKNNINTSHIPVVLLTAQTSDSQILDGFMFGADAYVTKPFNVKILLSNCCNILRSRRILYEKFANQAMVEETYNAINEQDQLLIEKAIEIIRNNFDNSEFDMNQLGAELGMGRSKLYIKIKEITGVTPNELTLNMKLKEAVSLLNNRPEMNISDIAFHLGFSSAKYFSKCFKTFYGMTPQDWRKNNKKD